MTAKRTDLTCFDATGNRFTANSRRLGYGEEDAKDHLVQEADKLAYQVVEDQQRDSWSHGDLLRLAHPKAPSAEHEAVFRWILSGAEGLGERTVKRKVNGEDRVRQPMPQPASCRRSLKPSRRPRRLRARVRSLV